MELSQKQLKRLEEIEKKQKQNDESFSKLGTKYDKKAKEYLHRPGLIDKKGTYRSIWMDIISKCLAKDDIFDEPSNYGQSESGNLGKHQHHTSEIPLSPSLMLSSSKELVELSAITPTRSRKESNFKKENSLRIPSQPRDAPDSEFVRGEPKTPSRILFSEQPFLSPLAAGNPSEGPFEEEISLARRMRTASANTPCSSFKTKIGYFEIVGIKRVPFPSGSEGEKISLEEDFQQGHQDSLTEEQEYNQHSVLDTIRVQFTTIIIERISADLHIDNYKFLNNKCCLCL